MSLISLLLFLIFLLTPHPLSAQGVNVSISLKDASLQQLLTEIESKSDIRFSYIDNDLDTRKDITITTNEAVESILDRILPGKGMKYTKTGNTIAVQKVSASQPVQKSITITGTVSENDMPMPGVNVLLKGTLTGVVTDVNGKYSINVPGRASVLVFSFVGFVPQEIIVNDRTVIDIRLEEATKAIDEVVIVGYGVQRKRDVTTSIASLRAEDIEDLPVNNVMEAMAGKLPGVQISQGIGKPGAPLSVKVRGVGTITAGSSPLYVVDGVPLALSEGDSPLNTINMNDIESIEVLKDASSAAIYGSRGSNGVVIITTKKGKDGKAVVSFNANWGWQSLSHKIKMLDAYQYADLVYDARNNSYSDAMLAINQGRANAGQAPLAYSFADNNAARLVNSNRNTNTIIPDEIVPYLERTPGLTNTDWQDEIYRVAPIQNYSLSVGGGTLKSGTLPPWNTSTSRGLSSIVILSVTMPG